MSRGVLSTRKDGSFFKRHTRMISWSYQYFVRFCQVIHYRPFQCSGYGVVFVSCFGVRVSVMFHFMFVHYTFSSVWVAE